MERLGTTNFCHLQRKLPYFSQFSQKLPSPSSIFLSYPQASMNDSSILPPLIVQFTNTCLSHDWFQHCVGTTIPDGCSQNNMINEPQPSKLYPRRSKNTIDLDNMINEPPPSTFHLPVHANSWN
ncbi:Uncharacterized protein Fot_30146 [Forsythia ovata]|uniref:Uncharacterized protein n=1 Tax=Forsythia ovata TaxID=205694 RepID=A0ABD1TTW8_9LAMI